MTIRYGHIRYYYYWFMRGAASFGLRRANSSAGEGHDRSADSHADAPLACVRPCAARGEDMMKFLRRQFLHLAADATALPVVSRIARAQTFPTRPVTMIVPFAAGGTTDIVARIVGEHMSRTDGLA
jgi:hypothetical protein